MSEQRRSIRSFVRRQGRLTPSQRRALEEQWSVYGIEYRERLFDFDACFETSAPLVLEIGFGDGQSLLQMAMDNPDKNYLGIEVHQPGVGAVLMGIEKDNITNLRVMSADAVQVLKHMVDDSTFETVQIFFPDPWHKKRHNKRRLIQTEFIDLLLAKTRSNGYLHLATDWEEYALQMMEVLSSNTLLKNAYGEGKFAPQNLRPETKFERRGHRLGHGVWDLYFQKM